jgi:hypothetical protein
VATRFSASMAGMVQAGIRRAAGYAAIVDRGGGSTNSAVLWQAMTAPQLPWL